MTAPRSSSSTPCRCTGGWTSARPSRRRPSRPRCRHHGLDLVDPGDDFTVTEFQEAADTALAAIAGRGRPRRSWWAAPACTCGWWSTALDPPGQWPDVRAELDADQRHGRPAPAAGRARPGRRRRGWSRPTGAGSCGRSRWPSAAAARSRRFGPGLTAYPSTDVVQLGPALAPRRCWPSASSSASPRCSPPACWTRSSAWRPRRVASRGPRRQALGYKELLAHLRGQCSLDEATDLAVTRTRQLAVRQQRWFRRDPRVRWVEMPDDGPAAPRAPRASPHADGRPDADEAPRPRQRLPRDLRRAGSRRAIGLGATWPAACATAASASGPTGSSSVDGEGPAGRAAAEPTAETSGSPTWPTSPCSSTTPTAAGPR